jgi:hypothetical protein
MRAPAPYAHAVRQPIWQCRIGPRVVDEETGMKSHCRPRWTDHPLGALLGGVWDPGPVMNRHQAADWPTPFRKRKGLQDWSYRGLGTESFRDFRGEKSYRRRQGADRSARRPSISMDALQLGRPMPADVCTGKEIERSACPGCRQTETNDDGRSTAARGLTLEVISALAKPTIRLGSGCCKRPAHALAIAIGNSSSAQSERIIIGTDRALVQAMVLSSLKTDAHPYSTHPSERFPYSARWTFHGAIGAAILVTDAN